MFKLKKHIIVIFFLIAIAIFTITGVGVTLFSAKIVRENTKIALVSNAYENVEKIRLSFSMLIISQRNYLITGKKIYYLDFLTQKAHLMNELDRLKKSGTKGVIDEDSIRQLDKLISDKIEMLETMIELKNRNESNAIINMIEEKSTPVFEDIQLITDKIEYSLENIIAEFRIFSRRKAKITEIAVFAGYSVAIVLLFFSFFALRFQIIQRTKAESELKKQAEELKEINAEKDKLFSIIAHDIKNPFVALLGLMELLDEPIRNKDIVKIKRIIGLVQASSKKTYDLLQNLLDWARMQTGRLIPDPSVLDVYELLLENKELLAESANKKHIKVLLSDEIRPYVLADRNMVLSVFRNILSNAIKFTPEKGEIKVDMAITEKEVIVSVADNGPGIKKEHLPKLFDSKANMQNINNASYKGTGLGLLLSKELITRNHGDIRAESEYGKGTVFFISIPRITEI